MKKKKKKKRKLNAKVFENLGYNINLGKQIDPRTRKQKKTKRKEKDSGESLML